MTKIMKKVTTMNRRKLLRGMNRVMKQLDCDSDDRHNNAHEDIVAKYEMRVVVDLYTIVGGRKTCTHIL